MVHNDIKLDNIIFSLSDKCFKLSDFGLSDKYIIDSYTYKYRVRGTEIYLHPDIIKYMGDFMQYYPPDIDYFSFGLMLLHLYCFD